MSNESLNESGETVMIGEAAGDRAAERMPFDGWEAAEDTKIPTATTDEVRKRFKTFTCLQDQDNRWSAGSSLAV